MDKWEIKADKQQCGIKLKKIKSFLLYQNLNKHKIRWKVELNVSRIEETIAQQFKSHQT